MYKLFNIHNTIIQSACVSQYAHINVSLHEPYLLDFFSHFFSLYIHVNLQPGSFLHGRSAFTCCLRHKRKLVGRTASCCLMIQKIQPKLLEVGHVDSHIFFYIYLRNMAPWPFLGERNLPLKKQPFDGFQRSVTTNGCCKTMVNHKPSRIHGILTCIDPIKINHSWTIMDR